MWHDVFIWTSSHYCICVTGHPTAGAAWLLYMWHDSFTCVIGHLFTGVKGLLFMWYDSFMSVTWQLYMWLGYFASDITTLRVTLLLYMRYRITICWRCMTFFNVTWLLYVCDMTALHVTLLHYMWHDYFTCDFTPLRSLQDNHLLALQDFSLCDMGRLWWVRSLKL